MSGLGLVQYLFIFRKLVLDGVKGFFIKPLALLHLLILLSLRLLKSSLEFKIKPK